MRVLGGLLQEGEFWVLVSFLVFLALACFLGVHRRLFALLDSRADRIALSLRHARQMRENARRLLAHQEKRRQGIASEIEDMMARSRQKALLHQEHMEAYLQDKIGRMEAAFRERIDRMSRRAVDRVVHDVAHTASRAVETFLKTREYDSSFSCALLAKLSAQDRRGVDDRKPPREP